MGCLRKRGQIDARTDSRTARVNIETGRAVLFAEAEEHGSLSSVVSKTQDGDNLQKKRRKIRLESTIKHP